MIKQYVKKPVVIEAVQWNGSNKQELIDFCGESISFEFLDTIQAELPIIKTLEGNMDVKLDSFVIKGVKGEFYPCQVDVFELTYDELVKTASSDFKEVLNSKETIPSAPTPKSLHNTNANGATKNVKDIQFWGNGDLFQLISKASSESEGWMKSTKAMQIDGVGCVVQVTTQQRNSDGSYAITDAVTFVEKSKIQVNKDENGEVISREIVIINKSNQ